MALDLLDIPLTSFLEQVLGQDEDRWPPEARFVVAAHRGNVRRLKEIARRLDTKGKRGVDATVAATTYRGMNALHAAVRGLGKLAVCRYLVDDVGMDVNMWDTSESKNTPLEHAVSGGNLPAARFLLDHGADLHQENEEGITVIHLAAMKGKSEIVKLLLSRGADVDAKSEEGTPLHLAAVKGHESTVEVLLEHHADINKLVPSCLLTPLEAAVFASSTPCAKLLIQAGANVNGVNNCLARAAREGFTEIAMCLLEAGANPNRPDEALRADPFDCKMLANRSRCWLRLGDGQKALEDATKCTINNNDWAEAHHRKGEALMMLKEYEKACEVLTRGLELDPENDEMDKLFWEAMKLKKK
ncbi:hypothetical protein ACQ4PT_020500 [Festuca glaucescens]